MLRRGLPPLVAAAAGVQYAGNAAEPGLDPKAFKPLKLAEKKALTADTAVYKFAYADPEALGGIPVRVRTACVRSVLARKYKSMKPGAARAAPR